jgi:hypothetical protein
MSAANPTLPINYGTVAGSGAIIGAVNSATLANVVQITLGAAAYSSGPSHSKRWV